MDILTFFNKQNKFNNYLNINQNLNTKNVALLLSTILDCYAKMGNCNTAGHLNKVNQGGKEYQTGSQYSTKHDLLFIALA